MKNYLRRLFTFKKEKKAQEYVKNAQTYNAEKLTIDEELLTDLSTELSEIHSETSSVKKYTDTYKSFMQLELDLETKLAYKQKLSKNQNPAFAGFKDDIPRLEQEIEAMTGAINNRDVQLSSLKAQYPPIEEYEKNSKIMKVAITKNPSIFKQMPESLRSNPIIASHAIREDGMNLEHTSYALQSNKEICELAVKNNPDALSFVKLDRKDKAGIEELSQKIKEENTREKQKPKKENNDLKQGLLNGGEPSQEGMDNPFAGMRIEPSSKKSLLGRLKSIFIRKSDSEEIESNKITNRKEALKAVREGGMALADCSEELRKDSEICSLVLEEVLRESIETAKELTKIIEDPNLKQIFVQALDVMEKKSQPTKWMGMTIEIPEHQMQAKIKTNWQDSVKEAQENQSHGPDIRL
jgi:hypothetical protein